MDKGKYWEKPDKYHIALDHPSSTRALMNHGSRHTDAPDTAPDATPSADDAPISKTRRKQQMRPSRLHTMHWNSTDAFGIRGGRET